MERSDLAKHQAITKTKKTLTRFWSYFLHHGVPLLLVHPEHALSLRQKLGDALLQFLVEFRALVRFGDQIVVDCVGGYQLLDFFVSPAAEKI